MNKIVVCGAGGFIGGHLVAHLKRTSPTADIRAVDIKEKKHWYQCHEGVDNQVYDLSRKKACFKMLAGADTVYNLAADMGGMGFIESHKAECMLSVLINTHLLMAAETHNVQHFFFASSACVYAADKQKESDVTALRESDAYPAMPEDGYGWEKLFSERMCRHFSEDFGLDVRVARFHNVYGPDGTWTGGREKAPAAICRKVLEAKMSGVHKIDIWGDGEQTRSFMYIDDCIEGIMKICSAPVSAPINLGSSHLVTINYLVDLAEAFAGIKCERNYLLAAPQGVRGRNSDNTEIIDQTGWAPSTLISAGMKKTYEWIEQQMK